MLSKFNYRRLVKGFNRTGQYKRVVRSFFRFRSSIYGWVIFIIAGSMVIVFVLFNIVFRSIYMDYFNRTISQNGDHISSIIEGSLYYSMLENDNALLQRTLDIISTMSGIDEVNLYDEQENLAYKAGYEAKLDEMKKRLKESMRTLPHTFGEFKTN